MRHRRRVSQLPESGYQTKFSTHPCEKCGAEAKPTHVPSSGIRGLLLREVLSGMQESRAVTNANQLNLHALRLRMHQRFAASAEPEREPCTCRPPNRIGIVRIAARRAMGRRKGNNLGLLGGEKVALPMNISAQLDTHEKRLALLATVHCRSIQPIRSPMNRHFLPWVRHPGDVPDAVKRVREPKVRQHRVEA